MRIGAFFRSIAHGLEHVAEHLEKHTPPPAPPPPQAPPPEVKLPTMTTTEQRRSGVVAFGDRQGAGAVHPAPPKNSPLFGAHQFAAVGATPASSSNSRAAGTLSMGDILTDDRSLGRLPGLPRATALLDEVRASGQQKCTLYLLNEDARTPREGVERALRRLIGVAKDGADPSRAGDCGLYLGGASETLAQAGREHADAKASKHGVLTVEVDVSGKEPRFTVSAQDLRA
jgi:hypothetical protein